MESPKVQEIDEKTEIEEKIEKANILYNPDNPETNLSFAAESLIKLLTTLVFETHYFNGTCKKNSIFDGLSDAAN
uniref:Uncharacterized protein n=1 Tax=Syphacia muris TaxID=451379 RepID=A0A0N5ATA5_9BILA